MRPVIYTVLVLAALVTGVLADDALRVALEQLAVPTPGEAFSAMSRTVLMERPAVVPAAPAGAPSAASAARPVPAPRPSNPTAALVADLKHGRQRIIHAIVHTYQAVPEQTDGDNAIAASGLRVWPMPPYPVVANNVLPFGTKVKIRGQIYTVADRMNRRYGLRHFDVLTQGVNYQLANEPVEIVEAPAGSGWVTGGGVSTSYSGGAQRGGRFSRNAESPSRASSVVR